jgi:3-oxoacyl-[acyl-carrier protein] reductase
MLLRDKIAVIYGVGPVGRAVAKGFAREGAKIFLAGRTLAAVKAFANELSADGAVVEAAQIDALDGVALDRHADHVVEQVGRIDISFNAVGVEKSIQGTPLIETPSEQIGLAVRDRITTNHATARAVARHMLKKGSGVT